MADLLNQDQYAAPPPQIEQAGGVPVVYSAVPPQPAVVPAQYAAAPAQVISIPQWRQELASYPELTIKQQIRAVEVLTNYEANNRYAIVDPSGRQVMYAGEDTDLLQRLCCTPLCRHWEVNVSQEVGGVKGSPFMHLEKDYTCTCLCFCRPEVRVNDIQGQNVMLGKLRHPFNWCDCPVDVKTPDNKDIMRVSLDGNCCTQPGICCACPCGPCKSVAFKAEDANGNEVAKMDKQVPGVAACMLSPETDNYHVRFVGERTPEEKALLLATALSIDLVCFSARRKN